MSEIWKDIQGYDGKYQVSNTGKVRSFAKSYRNGEGLILSPYIHKRGYYSVCLFDSAGKHKNHMIHRLVAVAFVPNPNGYNVVNHKDENKLNNNADNLEWCTSGYNLSYGTARLRQGITYGHPIEQMTVDGIVIAKYSSPETASKLLSIDASSIHKCCNGRRKYAGGYMWRFTDSL